MKKIEDFIEENYPNFSSCEKIAKLDDLYKLVHDEYEEGDSAHELLVREFGGDVEMAYPQIYKWYESTYLEVLIKSINTHLAKQG